ncbi:MAG: S41 family peptidase, partial [candidate division Zixibacteria bacterium]|nr:S41 family peptidase [candidate division Zixibacteria bacterium]
LILLLLTLCGCENHPATASAKFSASQLQSDFHQLRRLINRNHPMSFTDQQEMDSAFDRQFALLDDSLTLMEFFRIVAPAVSKVRCGHTRLTLGEPVRENLYEYGDHLPLDLRVVGDSLFVYETYLDSPIITPGSAVLSINGQADTTIIRIMKDCLYADGRNETFKHFLMNTGFRSLYLSCVGSSKLYEIVYMPSGGSEPEPGSVTLPARSLAEARQFAEENNLLTPRRPLVESFVADDNEYATLTIRFFDFYDDVQRLAKLVDPFFEDLAARKTNALILDLRGNDGGDPYSSAYLLGYLIGRPFRYFSSQSTPLYGDLQTVQPVPDHAFHGNLFVLVDGGCYSTTGHFCALLKSQTRAVFIGAETGGSYACHGGYREHRLRISGLELLLPHTTFIADAPGLDRGRGIEPDYMVTPSIDDLVNKTDPVLAKAISLAQDLQN